VCTAGRTKDRERRRWCALGPGRIGGVVFPEPGRCPVMFSQVSCDSGERTVRALEVPTIPGADRPVDVLYDLLYTKLINFSYMKRGATSRIALDIRTLTFCMSTTMLACAGGPRLRKTTERAFL
jgi:hypothetical protein